MPFRSVEFGDSIINMKSVLTTQSPWWYQLKTAPFSWHFSCLCFFPFFSFFLSRQIFSMAVVAPLPPRTCAMLQPRGTASSASGEAPCSPLLLPSFCAPQFVPSLARREQWDLSPISLRVTVQGQAELPALPPAESPEVSPPRCCRGSGLPFDKFHGKTPAYHHYLFISVSIPSIP